MTKTCEGCGAKCCKHVAIEIDTPTSLSDFEDIKWYVAHKNVNVFVDEDYQWHAEFLTPCEHLGENNLCGVYEKRPQICKDYNHDECIFHNEGEYIEKYTFKTIEDVEKYIKDVFDKGEHVIVDYEEADEEESEDDGEEDEDDGEVEEE